MRDKIVAGNWKMNNNYAEGMALTKEVVELSKIKADKDVKIIICPSFIHLNVCVALTEASSVKVGSQNAAAEASGAYTGEVSPAMIKSLGVEYAILGHSERRSYYGETNEILRKKVDLALANGLKPIYCCGETLEERQSNRLFDVVRSQVEEGLFHLTEEQLKQVVIAYEPVWAIGTGLTATSEQAQEMHAFIRQLLTDKYGDAVAQSISILYGGSCKGSNAVELFANKDVDGGLIGGASLNAEEFIAIVNSFKEK